MWISGLPGGISWKRRVAISPSLQPTTISASEAAIRSLAMREARPNRPAESGCVQAIAPLPDMVWATGIPKPSASACSAS